MSSLNGRMALGKKLRVNWAKLDAATQVSYSILFSDNHGAMLRMHRPPGMPQLCLYH